MGSCVPCDFSESGSPMQVISLFFFRLNVASHLFMLHSFSCSVSQNLGRLGWRSERCSCKGMCFLRWFDSLPSSSQPIIFFCCHGCLHSQVLILPPFFCADVMESGSWSLTWQLDWCEPEAPLEDSSIGFSVQESALRVLRDIMAPRILRLEDGVQSCPAAQTAFCTLCDGLQRIQRLAVQHLSSIPSNVLSLESCVFMFLTVLESCFCVSCTDFYWGFFLFFRSFSLCSTLME